MNFITLIDVQQSPQPNVTAFPSQTLSASPPPPPNSLNEGLIEVCIEEGEENIEGYQILLIFVLEVQ